MPSNAKQKAVKRSSWKKILKYAALVLGLGFVLHWYFSFAAIKHDLTDVQKLGYAQLQDVLQMRNALEEECKSANTLRNYLLLPLKNCHIFTTDSAQETKPETLEEGLYFYVTLLKSKENIKAAEANLQSFVSSWNKEEYASGKRFILEFTEQNAGDKIDFPVLSEKEEILRISLDPNEATYTASQDGEMLSPALSWDEFATKLPEFLKTAQEQQNNAPAPEITPPEVPEISADIPVTPPEENPDIPAEAVQILQSASFEKYLASLGYSLEFPAEKSEVFARIREGETVLREFFVNPENNAVMVRAPDGSNTASVIGLKRAIAEAQAQAESVDLDELRQITPGETTGRENYLLLGHNGGNFDTIMLAHIDNTAKKVTLISIPRDLFVDGLKINGFAAKYGMDAFLKKMEDLTGQRISGYVLIDFDIFIDGIDLLGGIDITLSRDVVDPSYKTFDDGVWGTMYFEKGTHHLSGVQALRLARSRATSSDFERAQRQQYILAAAKQKAKNISLANPNTIINLIRSMFRRVRTDIAVQDMITKFFELKDYELETGNVISSANILVSSKNDAGQYILTPKEDDWELIRKFIWQKILQ